MSNTLAKICADKLEHIEARKKIISPAEIEKLAEAAEPVRGFFNALKKKAAKEQPALIAEVKKASPSKGIIRKDFNPEEIAVAYQEGGAACLSVLTDAPYFMGKDEYLAQARNACTLPVLRKDFMLDPYQIYEARAIGADCILLIMAAISDQQAAEMEDVAIKLGMDVLAEAHNEKEIERSLKLKTNLIGINNRNLKTLEVNLKTTEQLAVLVPPEKIIVSESGINTNADVEQLKEKGIYCYLVGESLMRRDDIRMATKRLLGK